ncbi:uncharacterized protein LOC115562197 [Drosophila navojoa]|uniref:uncharacterized protein LOC115562197 n=1 Tax=Drosophila navojoa TaxID=7232 RepID=UPI0011BF02E8|nr:uncharacterized protein LOC115562197 [Drosophila navojoa]
MCVQYADANTNAIKHGVNESFQQQQQQQQPSSRGWGRLRQPLNHTVGRTRHSSRKSLQAAEPLPPIAATCYLLAAGCWLLAATCHLPLNRQIFGSLRAKHLMAFVAVFTGSTRGAFVHWVVKVSFEVAFCGGPFDYLPRHL